MPRGDYVTARRPASPDDVDELNLLDAELHADRDLSPVFDRLRAEAPLWWHAPRGDQPGFWVLSRYADIHRLYRDTARLASANGNMLGTLTRGGDPAGGQMLVVSDGARHAALRRVLTDSFAPRALTTIEECISRAAEESLLKAIAAGSCDFVADVAARVPLVAICELLGVPEQDRQEVLELTSVAMEGEHDDRPSLDARIARNEIVQYYTRLAAERRASPRDDIVSVLATCEVQGKRLSAEETVLNCYNLIIGGDETTRLSIAYGLLALAEHDEQWELLKNGDDVLPTAIEEILRWSTPAVHIGRTAVAEFELHGETVRTGDIVTLWNASANRDESTFADPYRFDVTRSPNKHLTFGYGPHFCIGAHLARTEMRSVLTAIRRHVDQIEVTGPVGWLPSNFINGITALPVRLTAVPVTA